MTTTPALLFASDIATVEVKPGGGARKGVHFGLLPVPVSVWLEWVDAGTAPAPAQSNPAAWNWSDVIAFIQAGAAADGSSPRPLPGHIAGAEWSFTDVLHGLQARGEV